MNASISSSVSKSPQAPTHGGTEGGWAGGAAAPSSRWRSSTLTSAASGLPRLSIMTCSPPYATWAINAESCALACAALTRFAIAAPPCQHELVILTHSTLLRRPGGAGRIEGSCASLSPLCGAVVPPGRRDRRERRDEASTLRVLCPAQRRGDARLARPLRRGRQDSGGRSEPRAADELPSGPARVAHRCEPRERARLRAPVRRRFGLRRAHPPLSARERSAGRRALPAAAGYRAAYWPRADPPPRHHWRQHRPCRSRRRVVSGRRAAGRRDRRAGPERQPHAAAGRVLPDVSHDGAGAHRATD